MSKTYTRKELYDLVWSKPITQIAEEFGLSDVAIHKICKKNRIPNPGLGYWAKIAANKPAKKTPFIEINGSDEDCIEIRDGLQKLLPEEFKTFHAKVKNKLHQKPTQTPDADPNILHPYADLLKQRIAEFKTHPDKSIKINGSKFFSISTSTVSHERIVSLVNALMKEAERAGFHLFPTKDGLRIQADGELIPVAITEKTEWVKHPLTEKEAKTLKKWEEECERDRRLGQITSILFQRPNIPEMDNKPNGLLLLEIDDGYHWDGLHRKFSDHQSSRIEKRISGIIGAILACAAAAKVRRKEEARRKKEAQREERARRRQELKEKRHEDLDQKIALWSKAEEMRRFAEAAQKTIIAPVAETTEWIEWILDSADRLDPLKSNKPQKLLQEKDLPSRDYYY